MKKYIGIALAVLMVVGLTTAAMAMSDSQVFKFKCRVQKYIEVNPAYKVLDITMSPISPPGGNISPPPLVLYQGWKDVVYANCKFLVSMTGTNPAGDGVPDLARKEVGSYTSGGYDHLVTYIQFDFLVNGRTYPIVYNSAAVLPGSWDAGATIDSYEAPHDGEVDLRIAARVDLPHLSPDWSADNTWQQSADAGTYKCKVIATYTAL